MNAPALFVGPLCRYFADADADASARVAGAEAWQRDLCRALAGRPGRPATWREDPSLDPQLFELGAHGLGGVRLLAVYAERPELELPDAVPDELAGERAWREAAASDFAASHHGQLLAASAWLPGGFDYTFRCPRPDGEDCCFGSLLALRDQLEFLVTRTFATDCADLEAWCRLDDGRFVSAARRGVATFITAARCAVDAGMPLLLRA